MIEANYPNNVGPEKQPYVCVAVNAYLETKTLLGEEVLTLEELASELRIDEGELNEWVSDGEIFRDSLTTLIKRLDENLVTGDPWANRADVMLVRQLLLETQSRHNKSEDS